MEFSRLAAGPLACRATDAAPAGLPSTPPALTLGVVIACFALRVNSLVPVITYHALWDMVQFLGGLWGADFGLLVTLGIVVNVIAGGALWWRVLRKWR